MNVIIESKPERSFTKTYPCLLEHLGHGPSRGGDKDWAGIVAMATSVNTGMVLGIPKNCVALDMYIGKRVTTATFDHDHWVEFKGRIILSNDVTQPVPERRLDPNL